MDKGNYFNFKEENSEDKVKKHKKTQSNNKRFY